AIITRRSKIILLVMVVLCAASAFLIPGVEMNTDMTKYLPNDSSMRKGIDIMADELDTSGTEQTIRVMFTDLADDEKEPMQETLASIEYVDSVDYEADSEDYNKDGYTLYVINTEYGYSSTEESSIEHTLKTDFSGYEMTYKNDDTSQTELPVWVIALALSILLAILIVMSSSWIEPLLFVITIGIAVVLNMGTNIVMGSIASITFSIGAILQLVLSMDYSIILMNRYRQEYQVHHEKKAAMEAALSGAFSSVAGSALTTIVGLIMLVFMSFKIGFDLGIVMAKGVFISMICVFTVLPGLVMIFSDLIFRTAKKTPDIPMYRMAGGIYKARWAFLPIFIALFIAAYFLQTKAGIAYTLNSDDVIADIFPQENSIVMLYNNEDEDKISGLADAFEDDENISSFTSYPTLLGKPYTVDEMADNIESMTEGTDMDISADLLSMLYYDYFSGDDLPTMTASEFIHFLADEVAENDTFADYISDDIRENIDEMVKFADADALTTHKSAGELADFLGMDEADLTDLLLYYFIEKGGVGTGSMTLPTFADFVVDEIANDEEYSSMFDADTLSLMKTLKTYTDADAMTKKRTWSDLASTLGMGASDMKLLYIYYYAQQSSYTPASMTVPDFVDLLCNDIANNSAFSSYFDSSTLAQVQALKTYTDTTTIQTQMTASGLAALFGMNASDITSLFMLQYMTPGSTDVGTMTLPVFANFVSALASDSTYSSMFDSDSLTQLSSLSAYTDVTAVTTPMVYQSMAEALGMDEDSAYQIYYYYNMMLGDYTANAAETTLSVQTVIDFIMENQDTFAETMGDSLSSLAMAQAVINYSVAGTKFSYSELANLTGMTESQSYQVFLLYKSMYGDTSGWTMSPMEFVDFLINDVASDENYGSMLDSGTMANLTMIQTIMTASVNGTKYSYSGMASLFGMDASTMKMLYTYKDADSQSKTWKLSVQTVINFIMNNQSTFGSMLGDNLSSLAMAQKIINGSVAGTSYSYDSLASLLGMDPDQARQLYLLYISRHGDTSSWLVSVQQLVDFIISDVLTNEDYADMIDADTADELDTAKTLIDAVVSGRTYTAAGLTRVISSMSDELDEKTMELLYLYYGGLYYSDPEWKLSLHEMFDYLADELVNDPRFSEMIDGDMRQEIADMQQTLTDSIAQMKGDNYSILLITSSYPEESAETTAFLDDLNAYAGEHFDGDFYLIGSSPMIYEMQQDFHQELLFITMLTAIAIFIVVAITFRSLIIPLILVLIVQCGVFITMSTCMLLGYDIYYLALLIVQCILMGATIDYGILFTNYYRDTRKKMEKKEALKAAYIGAGHTIQTSGLIMILVTFIIGISPADPTIAQICLTIAIGVLAAVLLIVLVLPGVLACADRFVTKKKKVK
ncbi:MAG: MMPL family transporter, partial [Clostridiales bacterium]|nr:MMPL family transporter [Clostridiales bacterium]